MSFKTAWKFARRELRAGVKGFRVLMLCLILGVASIASITSLRESISVGLQREGATILGGDAELSFTYRFASPDEAAWINGVSEKVSVLADFRSMLTADDDRALTQVKAVDNLYPLVGQVVLEPEISLEQALAGRENSPGIVLDQLLMDQLQLQIGDPVELGSNSFTVMAALVFEPDQAGAGFALGPRSIVAMKDLEGSSLLAPGTLFDTSYRLSVPEGTDLDQLRQDAEAALPKAGFQWQDRRDGAPGVREFVTRLSSFLVLVGLAGLAIGGVGVSAAVRAYLTQKVSVIATLKTLGASTRIIFLTYLMQIGILTLVSIVLGLIVGMSVPFMLGSLLQSQLPFALATSVHLNALSEAALYGLISALIFILVPIAQVESIRPAALYRDAVFGLKSWPRLPYLLVVALLLVSLLALAAIFTGNLKLVSWVFVALGLSFLTLALAGKALAFVSRKLAASRRLRGRIVLRHALSAVGAPGGETVSVVLSLGLGLTVLAAVGQIDANLRGAIDTELPERAPSYFVVDIQPSQIEAFTERLELSEAVDGYEKAPMLRGLITKVNGQTASDVVGDHWVIQGDRGITYADKKPENVDIVQGEWWPENFNGEAQISFSAEEAGEMGLGLGDILTINVLGRDIDGVITSLRDVDFSTAGMGFVLTMNPSALSGAPHSFIATVYAQEQKEAELVRQLAREFPNITTIRVRDAIERVVQVLDGIASATTLGAIVTLVIGIVVLFGAAAAGSKKRNYEAALLKTLGAARSKILLNFGLRSVISGAGAGLVALFAGSVSAWAVIKFVMDSDFKLYLPNALTVVGVGISLSVISVLMFVWASLNVRPSRELRSRND